MSNGRIVSQVVTEGNRRFDVVIRLSDTDRSTTGLAGLLVETPSGHVPLQLVAKIEETDGPNQILRENGQRRIAVYANSDGTRDRAQIVADIRDVTRGRRSGRRAIARRSKALIRPTRKRPPASAFSRSRRCS